MKYTEHVAEKSNTSIIVILKAPWFLKTLIPI